MKFLTPFSPLAAGLAAATLLAACEQSPVQPEPCARPIDGRCWEYLGLEGRQVWTLAESPWGIFAGTSDQSGGWGTDAGWFRLEEGSGEWERIPHFDGFHATPLYVEPAAAPPRLLVGLSHVQPDMDHGIPPLSRTLDGGQTWIPSDEGWTNDHLLVQTLAAEHGNGGRLFAGLSQERFMISDDAGESWRQSQGFANRQIYASPEQDGTVWALSSAIWTDLKRSDDRGESWTVLHSSTGSPVPFRLAYGGPRAGVLWGPAIRSDSSGSPQAVMLASEDRGDTWTETETPMIWGWDVAVRGSEAIVAGATEAPPSRGARWPCSPPAMGRPGRSGGYRSRHKVHTPFM